MTDNLETKIREIIGKAPIGKSFDIIAFNRRDGAYIITPDGKDERKISRNHVHEWSHDGDKLILSDNKMMKKEKRKLYSIDFSHFENLNSEQPKEEPFYHKILNTDMEIYFNIRGPGIIYLKNNGLFYLDENKKFKISDKNYIEKIDETVSISPNGEYLAFMPGYESNSWFRIFSLKNNKEIPFVQDLGKDDYLKKILGWQNNEKIIFTKDDSFFILDIKNDTREEINYDFPENEYGSIDSNRIKQSLSPDSKKVLLQQKYQSADLFIYDLETRKFKKLEKIANDSTNECWFSNFIWSPNNKSFVLDHRNHSTNEYTDPKEWDIYIFDDINSKPRLLLDYASDAMWRPAKK